MTDADRLKRAAAERAVELLEDGMVVGLGTGSTARHVIDVITAINTARASRTDVELGTILAANAAARNTVQGAAYLYVPLDPYGCTFQPLARQEDVRKGGK